MLLPRLLILAFAFSRASGLRVPGSPFPLPSAGLNASAFSPLLVFDNDAPGHSGDDISTVATLAGILSASRPRLFRLDGAATPLWLNATAALFGVTPDATTCGSGAGAVRCLLARFQGELGGYVLVDANSTNLGVMAGVARRAVSVSAGNEAAAIAANLTRLYDLRGRDLAWALAEFGDVFSSRVTVLQSPDKTKCMSDYAIAARALQWWSEDMQSADARSVLGALVPPFALTGWGPDEYNTVTAVSERGGAVIASDWASNLDVLSSFDLPQFNQSQRRPAPGSRGPAVHTVAFLMSDGDNVQFLLNAFPTGDAWWASPARGKVPMGWTLAPSVVDLAPVVADYVYGGASAVDDLVAGVSGFGYSYPDVMPAAQRADMAALTGAYLAKADMRVVNVLGHGEGYSAGDVEPLLQQDNVDAVLWYDFDDYSGRHGSITFVGGKPVIGGRFNLWGDGSSPAGPTFCNNTLLVQRLLAMPRDPTRAEGYSLVPLHAWSHSVADALFVQQALEAAAPGAFEVVTPTELVARVVANLRPPATRE